MSRAMRVSYALGRAIGAGAAEFLNTMWPAEKPLAHIPEPPRDASPCEPVVNDGSKPADPRWSTEAGEFHIERIERADYLGPHTMSEASAGVDDETEWFAWATPRIFDALALAPDSPQWSNTEWLARASAIVAETLSYDPAMAIAALWNYEIRKQEAT